MATLKKKLIPHTKVRSKKIYKNKVQNLVVAHSLGGRVGMVGAIGGGREGEVGRSREEGDNVWLWLEGAREEGERVVVAVG